jgi:hypothetical protein
MKVLSVAILFVISGVTMAHAIPNLQLFIDGATYDRHTASWFTTSSSFDLYVVSANSVRSDVIVSLALARCDVPAEVDVDFAGNEIDTPDWIYGYAPLDNYPDIYEEDGDLYHHNIYPSWFTEVHTGAYELSGMVGDVRPDANGEYWNPATGEGNATAPGQARVFHIETNQAYHYLHFDAYTLNPDGTIETFANFSRDAEAGGLAPEPGTVTLLGMGLLGLGTYIRRKSKL